MQAFEMNHDVLSPSLFSPHVLGYGDVCRTSMAVTITNPRVAFVRHRGVFSFLSKRDFANPCCESYRECDQYPFASVPSPARQNALTLDLPYLRN